MTFALSRFPLQWIIVAAAFKFHNAHRCIAFFHVLLQWFTYNDLLCHALKALKATHFNWQQLQNAFEFYVALNLTLKTARVTGAVF